MSSGFAIRNDHDGFRAVSSPDEIYENEYFSTEPVTIDEPSRHNIERLRLIAYADPITGSDRYFAEAARLMAIGGASADIDAATEAGITRAAEIAAMYPWPDTQQ